METELRYEISQDSEASIGVAVQLGRLPISPGMQLAARPPDTAPVGLKVALAAVRKLQGPQSLGLSDQAVSSQVRHIRRNLDWADNELANAPATAANARYRRQLEIARNLIARVEKARPSC